MKLHKFVSGNNLSTISCQLDTSASTNPISKVSMHKYRHSQNFPNFKKMKDRLSLSIIARSKDLSKCSIQSVEDENNSTENVQPFTDLITTTNQKIEALTQQIKELESENQKSEQKLIEMKEKKEKTKKDVENFISEQESFENLISTYSYEILKIVNDQLTNTDFKIEDIHISFNEIQEANKDKFIEQIQNFISDIIVGNPENNNKFIKKEILNCFRETEKNYKHEALNKQAVNFFFNYMNIYITLNLGPTISKIKTFSLIYKYFLRVNYINTKLEGLVNFLQKEYKKTKKDLKTKIQNNKFQISSLEKVLLNEKNNKKLYRERKDTEKQAVSPNKKSHHLLSKTTLSFTDNNTYNSNTNTNPNNTYINNSIINDTNLSNNMGYNRVPSNSISNNNTTYNYSLTSTTTPPIIKQRGLHFKRIFSHFTTVKPKKRKNVTIMTETSLHSSKKLGNNNIYSRKISPSRTLTNFQNFSKNIQPYPYSHSLTISNSGCSSYLKNYKRYKDPSCLYRKLLSSDEKFNPLIYSYPPQEFGYLQGTLNINHKDQFLKIYPQEIKSRNLEIKIPLKSIQTIVVENYMSEIINIQKGKKLDNTFNFSLNYNNGSQLDYPMRQKALSCKYYTFTIVYGSFKEKVEIIFSEINSFNYWMNGLNIYAENNSKNDLNRYESLNSFHQHLNNTPSFVLSKHFHSIRDRKIGSFLESDFTDL